MKSIGDGQRDGLPEQRRNLDLTQPPVQHFARQFAKLPGIGSGQQMRQHAHQPKRDGIGGLGRGEPVGKQPGGIDRAQLGPGNLGR